VGLEPEVGVDEEVGLEPEVGVSEEVGLATENGDENDILDGAVSKMSRTNILISPSTSDEEDEADLKRVCLCVCVCVCVSPRGCNLVHPIWEIQFSSEGTLFMMYMSLEKPLNRPMY
jgi:hypothetical protein